MSVAVAGRNGSQILPAIKERAALIEKLEGLVAKWRKLYYIYEICADDLEAILRSPASKAEATKLTGPCNHYTSEEE